jgi:hypothetical protein
MNNYRRGFNLLKLCTRSYNLTNRALTYLPVRMVHERGYNDFYDNWSFKFHEVNFALGGSRNTENFVFIFKKYGKIMTDF